MVLKAILVVASSTWNNAHKCKWQNTKFTCFVFFLLYKKFINQAIQKSLSLSFHDFAHTQLLSNSMSLFLYFFKDLIEWFSKKSLHFQKNIMILLLRRVKSMYYEIERDRDELLIYFMRINDNTSQMFVWWTNRMAVQLKRKYNLRYHMKLFCIARRKEEI